MDEPRDRDELRLFDATEFLDETRGMQSGDSLAQQKSWTSQAAETSGDLLMD
jgi:hypothetical protein